MYIVDDPLLALITRFMGDSQNVAVSDTEFLIRQINAIEDYIGQFPNSERDERAIEWIAAHAREYRRQWQKKNYRSNLGQGALSGLPTDRNAPVAALRDSYILAEPFATLYR